MEILYQYLWRYGLFGRTLPLSGGGKVRIVNPGILNLDSGPDFFNSRLDFGEGTWAGNVEIHVKASDWYRHGHHEDRAYDSVLLHVVAVNDRLVFRLNGEEIPAAQVSVPKGVCLTYADLCSDRRGLRCASRLKEIPEFERVAWIESLAMERLQYKAQRVADSLSACGGDWERAAFITLARGLGFGLNKEPMEELARRTPSNFLGRHSDNLQQLEALLFGQAGLLDPSRYPEDMYYRGLCREYAFLSRKYSLRPMKPEQWKFARTRPGNFPLRRIALLARSLYGGRKLMGALLAAANGGTEALAALFGWELEGYWRSHAVFGDSGKDTGSEKEAGKEDKHNSGKLSRQSLLRLVANVAVPVLYAYGAMHGDPDLAERMTAVMEEMPPERNSKTRPWVDAGFKPGDALRAQALMHLHEQYCDRGRCNECRYAYSLVKNSFPEPEEAPED